MVKIKTVNIIGGTDWSSPSSVKLFINKDNLTLGDVEEMQPTQTIELVENYDGLTECLTRYS